jgi:hypothetical protein
MSQNMYVVCHLTMPPSSPTDATNNSTQQQ